MINTLSVRSKHLLIIGIVTASFVLIGIFGAVVNAKLHRLQEAALEVSELNAAMLNLRRHEKDFLYRQDEVAAEKFQRTYGVAETRFDNLLTDLTAAGLATEDIEQIRTQLAAYAGEFQRIAAAGVAAESQPQRNKQIDAMRAAVHATENLFERDKDQLKKHIESAEASSESLLAGLLIGCATLCAGLIFWVSRSIYAPLAQLSGQVGAIARDRDLTARVPVGGSDEISAVGGAFNELLETLQQTILEVLDGARLVAGSAEQMANITRDVRQAAARQSREVELAAVAVNEMSGTIQEIARNAAGAADSVSSAHQQLQTGSTTGSEARREIEKLTEEVQEVVDAIQTLSEHSNNIGQVLDAIRAVAEQTNLLALNAAIEAARAGDQGRGFAVVADEVRTLAKKTQDSTETIRQTIQQLQQGTQQAVGTVDRASLRASQGIEQVSRTARTLNDIADNVSSISDLNLQIAAAAEQQSVAAEEVSRNVVRVTDLSREVAGQAEQTAQASEELSKLGVRLQNLVRRFRV